MTLRNLKFALFLFTLTLPASAVESVKAIGAVAKANVKAVGAVAESNIKAVGAVDNTSGAGYTATSADFAGDGQTWMERDGDLTGFTDGKACTISFWVRFDGSDGVLQRILYNGRVTLTKLTDNTLRFTGEDAGSVNFLFRLDTTGSYTAGATWHHVIYSLDKSVETRRHCYVDGADVLSVVNFLSDDVDLNTDAVDFARGEWSMAAITVGDGATDFNGCLSEVVFHNTYLDLSNSANREKFRTAGGAPADIASTNPFGATPILYLKGAGASDAFIVNSGSGGDFVKYGTTALTTGSTSPP